MMQQVKLNNWSKWNVHYRAHAESYTIEFYNKIDDKLMTNAIETIITDDDDVDLPE